MFARTFAGPKDNSGYSIIELLCYLSISSALLAVAYPGIAEEISRGTLRSTSTRIRALLVAAQQIAISKQRVCDLEFQSTRISSSNCNIPTLVLPNKIMLNASFGNLDSTKLFLAYPQYRVTPGSLTLANKSMHCKITIGLRGAIRASC